MISKAAVELTGAALIGAKSLETDSSGYYRFANLPPGVYTIRVKAAGFSDLKREGIVIEVGHLPTVDLVPAVGAAGTVVEVNSAAPVIDVTTNANTTNITNDVISDIPHGYSFQSVIQFAPMARNEPLAGGSAGLTGNAGGSLPGSAGNGMGVGYSVGGAADSENTYLVEGQDTENISGGASSANVPFQFIQEVQVKTFWYRSGARRRPGWCGQRGNEKGSNAYQARFLAPMKQAGSTVLREKNCVTIHFQSSPLPTLIPSCTSRERPFPDWPARLHHRRPIAKDRLWFFLGLAPQYSRRSRMVDFTNTTNSSNTGLGLGNQIFNQGQTSSTSPLSGLTPRLRRRSAFSVRCSTSIRASPG